jgi:predicted thioredoxin/glutaredoxin
MTDRVRLTREFTKQRDLQSVPSIYINGIKMSDPFNLQEMEDILQGNIKEGDTFHLPLTD